MAKPRPSKTLQRELFRVALDKIINPDHEMVLLADKIDWQAITKYVDKQFDNGVGQPPLQSRLVIGIIILKYLDNLSDDVVIKRWTENPYYQYFCGMKYFQHELPCHPSSLSRWRKRISRGGAEAILKQSIKMIQEGNFVKKEEFQEIFIDTTVQEKNICYPTEAKLLSKARDLLVKKAKKENIILRQTYEKETKSCLISYGRNKFHKNRQEAKRILKRLRTMVSRLLRDVTRKSQTPSDELANAIALVTRLLNQKKHSKDKIYSLHAPEVRCIAKGKAHKKYEFGNKVSVSTTINHHIVVGIHAFYENHYDEITLSDSLFQIRDVMGLWAKNAYVDRGYKGYDGHIFGTKVHIQGGKNQSAEIKSKLKQRARIEPVISHLKADHRMDRNRLHHTQGDILNCLMAGCAFNLRKLMKWLKNEVFYLYFYIKVDLFVGARPRQLAL